MTENSDGDREAQRPRSDSAATRRSDRGSEAQRQGPRQIRWQEPKTEEMAETNVRGLRQRATIESNDRDRQLRALVETSIRDRQQRAKVEGIGSNQRQKTSDGD